MFLVPVVKLFSKRKLLAANANKPDVYRYDSLPVPLRVQIDHIWVETIGLPFPPNLYSYSGPPVSNQAWEFIEKTVAREHGVFQLGPGDDPFRRCEHLLLNEQSIERVFDLVELSFRWIDKIVRDTSSHLRTACNATQDVDDAIDELNYRFREHGVGYQFEAGNIVRLDAQFTHDQVVRPALQLIADAKFSGAEQEFMRAHEHYRHRRYGEAIADALKSFESTMKTICDARRLTYGPGDTAKNLIDIMVANGIVPTSLTSEFTSMRSLLESGLPTVRNRNAGHGQGPVPVAVPIHLAAFALHTAAANITFLVSSHLAP